MSVAAHLAPEAAPLKAVLDRLGQVVPQAAQRAGEALVTALDGTRRSCWPEIAWRASSLTSTGFPVELSWSSRDPAVRWAAEATGPETPESERLSAALAVLQVLGVDADVPDWLVPHPGQELRFGAWVGGRHDGLRDRYKLYVDLAGAEMPDEMLRSPILETVPRRVAWRMAGVDTGTGMIELYGQLAKPEIWEVERLFVRCGLDVAPVLQLTEQLIGLARGEILLSGTTSGFSLAMANGGCVAAGLFVYSGLLFGDDPEMTRRLRLMADHYGWDLAMYDALLGSGRPERPRRNGPIGFGVAADGTPWLQVGLPP